MKKLADDEKLTRGVQILLTAQDKADLTKIALETGVSLSAAARPHVQRALERWRAKNPEAASAEPPASSKPLVVGGKTVRSNRVAELYASKANGATAAASAANGASTGVATESEAQADTSAKASRNGKATAKKSKQTAGRAKKSVAK
jgi:transposase-like protein